MSDQKCPTPIGTSTTELLLREHWGRERKKDCKSKRIGKSAASRLWQ